MRRIWWVLTILGILQLTLSALGDRSSSDPRVQAIRLNNLGVAYMNNQRFEKAQDFFERACDMDPTFTVASLNQGIALLNLQHYERAEEILLQIVEREPNSPRAWYNLGLLYKNRGRIEKALTAFQRVAELDPEDADTHYFRGLLYAQLQQYEPAIAAFEQALRLNPLHASAEFGLARAYQRTGETSRARRHLERFQYLLQEKLGAPMSLRYGDQGLYSLVQEATPPTPSVPKAIPVRFIPVTSGTGLNFLHQGGNSAAGEDLAGFLGSGACFFDYDNDGRNDVFLVNSGTEALSELYGNQGKDGFVPVGESGGLEARGYGLGCAAGDYDNDGRTDLAVGFSDRVVLFRNQEGGTFRDVTRTAGIHANGLPLGLNFVDYDHDGDLDLFISQFVRSSQPEPEHAWEFPFGLHPASSLLWRNNGNGTFTNWTEPAGLASLAATVGAMGADFNNDRAIDLVLTGWRKAPAILMNPREGRFRLQELWGAPMPAPTAGLAVFDFNKDGWMDVAFTHWGAPGVTLWRNREGRRFERVELPASNWVRGWGIVSVDYDNDGWLDIAVVGEAKGKGEIVVLRNRGPEGFENVTRGVELADLALTNPRALVSADYDNDGDADLLVTQNHGPVILLRNEGGNRHNWLRVSLKGMADNRSAIGTKIQIFSGALWQKWEIQAASGYLGQSAVEVTAGLRTEKEAEIVRLLWPTGVLQDEIQLAVRAARSIQEIDRKGSSCPVLFAWDGHRYRFVTDVIGAGIAGHWVAPRERNISDPTEYIKVEDAHPRHGLLSFRFVEPMEEVVYLDQVRLLALDHPADAEVYPNEYFAGRPPFPEFRVITSRQVRPPLGVWDDQGRDVTPELRAPDRQYVTSFDLLSFKGFAELHGLEIDLGEWEPSRPLRLLLHGFVDYFTATSVYAAHQAGIRPVPPYVEALDSTGRWVRVMDNIGFPAGLARPMVADLSGRLPEGTRRIRLVTNLQIYWDQVLVDTTAEDIPVRITEVPLAEASVGFLGYPRSVEGNPKGDLTYLYEEISRSGPYVRHLGAYTRYGDVRELLTDAEDKFVIFGSGDEVALEFDPSRLPALPPGWTRDYFFYADGFAKDMDFYAAYAFTVEPLPFHTDQTYPYSSGKGYPDTEPYLEYRLRYNTRVTPGLETRPLRFRFDYGE